jgi:hypothetical protein
MALCCLKNARTLICSEIWCLGKQRNDLKHGNVMVSEEQILKRIDWEIQTRVLGAGKIKNLTVNKAICCRWGFQDLILCK